MRSSTLKTRDWSLAERRAGSACGPDLVNPPVDVLACRSAEETLLPGTTLIFLFLWTVDSLDVPRRERRIDLNDSFKTGSSWLELSVFSSSAGTLFKTMSRESGTMPHFLKPDTTFDAQLPSIFTKSCFSKYGNLCFCSEVALRPAPFLHSAWIAFLKAVALTTIRGLTPALRLYDRGIVHLSVRNHPVISQNTFFLIARILKKAVIMESIICVQLYR